MRTLPDEINEVQLECAKANFEMLEHNKPELLKDQIYILAKYQLDTGLGYKSEDEFVARKLAIEESSK